MLRIDDELFSLERVSDRSISWRKNSPECAYFDRGSTATRGLPADSCSYL